MKDPNEIPEVVGSRDLRETFDKGRTVQGGLFINNFEIQPFQANGISALLSALNAAADRTFVDASIDDGYHLVLEARSPGPIRIRAGAAYEQPQVQPVDPGARAVADAIAANRRDRDDKPKNSLLEDLGLGATEDGAEAGGITGPAHPPAGMNAKDRHEARHRRAMAAGAIRGYTPMTDRQGNLPERHVGETRTEDQRFNPTPGEKRIPA